MRLGKRSLVVSMGCLAATVWLFGMGTNSRVPRASRTSKGASVAPLSKAARQAARFVIGENFPDPNAPGTPARVYVDRSEIDQGIYRAILGGAPAREDRTLAELKTSLNSRASASLAAYQAEHDRLPDPPQSPRQAFQLFQLRRQIAFVHMAEGRFGEATSWLEWAMEVSGTPGMPADLRANVRALLGVVALRQGELANCIACLGPSSCILPIAPEAVHTRKAGSREAIRQFTMYLEDRPGDLRVRWLLNLAYMTLGEYPDKVPPAYLIKLDPPDATPDPGRFSNVAPLVGLDARGPNLAGGSIFDDFNGDGLPDLFSTSLDADKGAALFVNRGDGTFEDRSTSAGLDDQIYALNVARADYDNDGDLDVVLLRGGWEKPMRMSLLRNTGAGAFEDVTDAGGLAEPIQSEAAAWGDFDNDGRLDLYVCGEYLNADGNPTAGRRDPRNRSRLYRNQGDGTFVDVAGSAGVLNDRCAKGVAWGDYDDDGHLDLFVSNMNGASRMYRNKGDGTFVDVAAEVGIAGSASSFSCLFWDYDNDGRLDLFLNDFAGTLSESVADLMGLPVAGGGHPRLYRNIGDGKFRDVSQDVGLGRPIPAMSVNCGDIDNDGFLDLHLGTGWMSYAGLIPDRTLRSVGGGRFEDVTGPTGTGHLQKGHGISFADWDFDGDLDLYAVLGGGFPGDRGYNTLFQNPGQGRHWLKLKLVGKQTNRSAIGAKIRVDIEAPGGPSRSIFRTVGNNGSFGGNSLNELVGLLDDKSVARLTITWPTSKTTQTFHDLAADQAIEITEGSDTFVVLRQPPLHGPKVATKGENIRKLIAIGVNKDTH
ncbi:CRTAC1 family protein [Isosphaeraceae bacterium EP7]